MAIDPKKIDELDRKLAGYIVALLAESAVVDALADKMDAAAIRELISVKIEDLKKLSNENHAGLLDAYKTHLGEVTSIIPRSVSIDSNDPQIQRIIEALDQHNTAGKPAGIKQQLASLKETLTGNNSQLQELQAGLTGTSGLADRLNKLEDQINGETGALQKLHNALIDSEGKLVSMTVSEPSGDGPSSKDILKQIVTNLERVEQNLAATNGNVVGLQDGLQTGNFRPPKPLGEVATRNQGNPAGDGVSLWVRFMSLFKREPSNEGKDNQEDARRKPTRLPLLGAIAFVIIGGLGAAAWWFGWTDSGKPAQIASPAAAPTQPPKPITVLMTLSDGLKGVNQDNLPDIAKTLCPNDSGPCDTFASPTKLSAKLTAETLTEGQRLAILALMLREATQNVPNISNACTRMPTSKYADTEKERRNQINTLIQCLAMMPVTGRPHGDTAAPNPIAASGGEMGSPQAGLAGADASQ